MGRQRGYPTLRHWRKAMRYDQATAAQKLGISQPYYSRLERGEQMPRAPLAKTISDETGVPLETVLGVA